MNNFNIKSFMHLIKKHKFKDHHDVEILCHRLRLNKLGEGSSRSVFAINKKYVIKVAINSRGFAQNEAEACICNHPKAHKRVARVVGSDARFHWIIAERAEAIFDHAWKTRYTSSNEYCFNFSYGKDFGLHEIEVGMLNGRKVAIDYGGTRKVISDHY